jgi:hypothetical protein
MAGHLGLKLPKSMKFAYCVVVNFQLAAHRLSA